MAARTHGGGAPGAEAALWAGLPRRFWWLWGGLLINRGGTFVQPLLTFYLTQDRELPLSWAAVVVSVYGAGAVVGSLVGGVAADRIGRRSTLLISAVAGASALALLGAARGFWPIAIMAFVTALAWDLHRPAVHAMVADLIPPADRVRAFGLQYVAVNLGFAVAPALAGWLAGYGYGVVFAAAAAVQLVWAVFVALALPETRVAPAAGAAEASVMTAIQDRVYLPFLALCGLLALLPSQASVALSAHLASQGHGPATFGTVLGLNGLLIVLVQPWVLGPVGRRDVPGVFMVGAALFGVGFALHGVSPFVWVHAAAVATWTVGEILVAPVQSGVVAALAPPEARGRYQGLMATSFAASGMVGPVAGAAVLERGGAVALWGGCLAVGLGCAVGMSALGPTLRARLRA
jgi:MFS family permease